jgi:hypothetical protein
MICMILVLIGATAESGQIFKSRFQPTHQPIAMMAGKLFRRPVLVSLPVALLAAESQALQPVLSSDPLDAEPSYPRHCRQTAAKRCCGRA